LGFDGQCAIAATVLWIAAWPTELLGNDSLTFEIESAKVSQQRVPRLRRGMFEEAFGGMAAKLSAGGDKPGIRSLGEASEVTNAASPIDVIEIAGAIKWFDVAKGFGFIVPDDGRPDVLLHVTCLRRDGFQTAYEGARVVVEALNRPGGLQAFRILSMDESTARHPAQMPAPRTHVVVEPTSKLERLEVKWFNRIRGFGFLSAGEGTPDIFVHMETLRRFGITELRPGQYVLVRYGNGPKGLMVAEIRPDGWGDAPSSH
jgi:CspA family cold shock protein